MILAETTSGFNNGIAILFTILTVILVSGLTVLLFFSVKKERKNYKNEVAELIEGVLKKSEIISSINRYINQSPSTLVFSLIMIDFDKFLELQNAFGNENSKKILTESVKNIRKILPNRALIGRIGEDRFVVLVKEDYDKNETLRVANKIKESANQGIKIYADTVINPTVSVGVAFYPTHGKTYKQLMSSLDLAVFSAKNSGGNTVSLYSDEFDKEDIDNLQFYYEVKEAIKQQQFILYYQPIINMNDNTVYGLEALLRWNHPSLGVLPPSSFINILEQSGDINVVGVWGIETLIKQYIELRKTFIHKELQLSINLSPKQLLSETLGITFQRIAKKYKIPVDHITIEIEEFAMFEKHEIVYQNINNLKEIGFKIAVDGFGIDQNTLAKLGDAPIDIIKLDKNFMSDEDNYIQNKYLELLIDYAQKTNKLVICEGVEDYATVEKLKGFGVNYLQGYYFSKPISQDAIREYISNEERIIDLANGVMPIVEEADPNEFKITVDKDGNEVVSEEVENSDAVVEGNEDQTSGALENQELANAEETKEQVEIEVPEKLVEDENKEEIKEEAKEEKPQEKANSKKKEKKSKDKKEVVVEEKAEEVKEETEEKKEPTTMDVLEEPVSISKEEIDKLFEEPNKEENPTTEEKEEVKEEVKEEAEAEKTTKKQPTKKAKTSKKKEEAKVEETKVEEVKAEPETLVQDEKEEEKAE